MFLVQAFNELADELALLYAQSLSDYDDDELNNHHDETEANNEENENVGVNTEVAEDAQEEIVELDTIGDFEKMSHGREFITLQVTRHYGLLLLCLLSSMECAISNCQADLLCPFSISSSLLTLSLLTLFTPSTRS